VLQNLCAFCSLNLSSIGACRSSFRIALWAK
jgi:hypothetical protein